MRSTLTHKVSVVNQMPLGRRAPQTVGRILSKAHRSDILRALAKSKEGLTYGYIDLEITRRSGTNVILIELCEAGLAAPRDGRYHITDEGRRRIVEYDVLDRPIQSSTRNGGAGVH